VGVSERGRADEDHGACGIALGTESPDKEKGATAYSP